MKPAIPLCLAMLFTLTACGQTVAAPAAEPSVVASTQTAKNASLPETSPLPDLLPLSWQVSEPKDWALDASQFPTRLADGQAELSYAFDKPFGTMLLAQLSEQDTSLYGVWDRSQANSAYEGLILQIGDKWEAYALPWYTPRCIFPQLHQGDFDGDGVQELAILTYTGSGTGVSAWTLSLAETDRESWQVRTVFDSAYEDVFAPYFACGYDGSAQQVVLGLGGDTITTDVSYLQLAPDVELEAYTGPIVSYGVEGDTLTANLAVGVWGSGAIPYTLFYPADIQAQLNYQEDGFFLSQVVMTDENLE